MPENDKTEETAELVTGEDRLYKNVSGEDNGLKEENSADVLRVDGSNKIPTKTSAKASFGELDYDIDVNPIVMTKEVSPLDDFNAKLKMEDQYQDEEEKKKRVSQLQRINTVDTEPHVKEKPKKTLRVTKDLTLVDAVLAGENPSEIVKDVNKDYQPNKESQSKKDIRRDIAQNNGGVDVDSRVQARNDRDDVGLLDTVTNSISLAPSVSDTKETDSVESEATTQFEKEVHGQDDNSLGLTDAKSGLDNIDDLPDLLNQIQADFEIVDAKTVMVNNYPMINAGIQLKMLPQKIKDKNGFVINLSKRDLARMKQQLSKMLRHPVHMNIPINTFNAISTGNGRSAVVEKDVITRVQKGEHIDYGKSIIKDRPLLVTSSIHSKIKDNQVEVLPDFRICRTPIDVLQESRDLRRIQELNQKEMQDFEKELKIAKMDRSHQETYTLVDKKTLEDSATRGFGSGKDKEQELER